MVTLKVKVTSTSNGDRVIKRLIKTNYNYTVSLSNLNGLLKGHSTSNYKTARIIYAAL